MRSDGRGRPDRDLLAFRGRGVLNERPGPLVPSEPRLDPATPLEPAHMIQPPHSTSRPGIARLPAGFAGFCCEDLNCPECLRAYRKGLAFRRQERAARKLRQFPPDGLKTATQAAAKLNCSTKTLNGHVASGALKYVALGHGKRRTRRMITDADLDNFIANQTHRATPCLSTASRAHHSGTMTFTGAVIDFRGPRKPPTSAKRKK